MSLVERKKALNNTPLLKMIIVYILVILFGGFILFPMVWGATGGMVSGKLFSDPSFQSELIKHLGKPTSSEAKNFWINLPPEKKLIFESLVKERFKAFNWFPIHLTVNIVTFSVLGFLVGIFLKNFLFSGIIPLTLSFLTFPVLTNEDFMINNVAMTVIIALLSQLAAVYLFSYFGYMIRSRQRGRK